MKRIICIFMFLATALMYGCEEEVFTSDYYDRARTGRMVFGEVDYMLDNVVETAAKAFVLSTYMDAETDAERLRIEDSRYYYYKLRNDGTGGWSVVGDSYLEEYFASDNKSLSEENASWLVEVSSAFRGNRFDNSEIIIRRIEQGRYKMVLSQAKVGVLSKYDDFDLEKGVVPKGTRYTVDGELTTNTDFFLSNGQGVGYSSFSLTGTMKMVDSNNANYSLSVEIVEPLRIAVDSKYLRAKIQSGTVTVKLDETLSNTHETIVAKYMSSGDTVSIDYQTAHGKFIDTYDTDYSYYYDYRRAE